MYKVASLRNGQERLNSFVHYDDTKDRVFVSQLYYLSLHKHDHGVWNETTKRLNVGSRREELSKEVVEDFDLVVLTELFDLGVAILVKEVGIDPMDYIYMKINTGLYNGEKKEGERGVERVVRRGREIGELERVAEEDEVLYREIREGVVKRFEGLPQVYRKVPLVIDYVQKVIGKECRIKSTQKEFSREDNVCMYRVKKELFERVWNGGD